MNDYNVMDARLIIRVCKQSLAFAVADATAEEHMVYEPYVAKSGISIAANLREAFREARLLGRGYRRAQVLIDSPVLLIPLQEYEEEVQAETLYHHTFPSLQGDSIECTVMAEFNAVAVYPVNKDLRTVLEDHFQDVRYEPLMLSVWQMMYQRNFTGTRKKLYGSFHDGKLEVFSFEKNRFRFCNTFETRRPNDAVFFLMYVWKQLAMDTQEDELHLSGELPEREQLMEMLHRYVKNVHVVRETRSSGGGKEIKGMPLDLVCRFC